MSTAPPATADTPSAAFLDGLPKCELHLHIEGTLEPREKLAFAERNGIELPQRTVEEIQATYVFDSLATFLPGYYDGMRVLLTEQDFHDLAWAYLVKADSQNVRYVEMFFDPQAHTSRGVPFPTVVMGLRSAILRAERELGIRAALIMCFLRDFTGRSYHEKYRALRDAGVRIAVNSDDPSSMRNYITENVADLAAEAGLTRDEVVRISRDAFTIAWLPAQVRDRYLAELDEYASAAASAADAG